MELLKDILGRYLQKSGLTRRLQHAQLLGVWQEALGPQSEDTQLEAVRKNVAYFRVGNAPLLAELNNFRKLELLSRLQSEVAAIFIRDIKFRLGRVEKG